MVVRSFFPFCSGAAGLLLSGSLPIGFLRTRLSATASHPLTITVIIIQHSACTYPEHGKQAWPETRSRPLTPAPHPGPYPTTPWGGSLPRLRAPARASPPRAGGLPSRTGPRGGPRASPDRSPGPRRGYPHVGHLVLRRRRTRSGRCRRRTRLRMMRME